MVSKMAAKRAYKEAEKLVVRRVFSTDKKKAERRAVALVATKAD